MRNIFMRYCLFMMLMITLINEVSAFSPHESEIKLQEQNGKLLFPIMDPKTGKYTVNLERAEEITRQYDTQSQNQKGG